MKTALRYLLIVAMVSVASMVFATAQSLAQKPKVEMKSTSGMVYSGSNLPQAAAKGTVLTGWAPGTYTPADEGPSGRRKVSGGHTGGGPDDREDPYADPLGDVALPLMLLALAYVCARAFLKKRA